MHFPQLLPKTGLLDGSIGSGEEGTRLGVPFEASAGGAKVRLFGKWCFLWFSFFWGGNQPKCVCVCFFFLGGGYCFICF